MITFNQVIDDLYQTEKPVHCIFSFLGTDRCPNEIPREQLESRPSLLKLITESNYDVQNLDLQLLDRLLCPEHQNMDNIQQIMQSWLWDQDAMHLSMPGNETEMGSRDSLDNPTPPDSSAPATPRSLGSEASNHTTLSTPYSQISPSAAYNTQEDVSTYETARSRRSAGSTPSGSQPRRREGQWPVIPSPGESPIVARFRRQHMRNEAHRAASAPEIPISQPTIAETTPVLSRKTQSDESISSSNTNFTTQTPRSPLSNTDSTPEIMPGSFGSENTSSEEDTLLAQPNGESDNDDGDPDAMSIDSIEESTPLVNGIDTVPSTNHRPSYNITSSIQDANSIDDTLRMKIKESLPKKDKQRGYVYIFRDPARPNLLKIGKTDLEVSKRQEMIEKRCHITLETVYQEGCGTDLLPFRNCQRAEQLVHKELANYNRRHRCPTCKSRHKEWFEVSEELAKKTVQRWVSFIRKLPYDENGVLHDFWQERLYLMERPNVDEKPEDHDIRHQRWNFVITATYFHFWKHWAWKTIFAAPEKDRPRESLYFKLVRFRWQLFALFSWLIVAVKSFPSEIMALIFVIITFIVLFEFLKE